MSKTNKKYDSAIYFDKNTRIYDAYEAYSHEQFFIDYIKKTSNNKMNLLDIGGGKGTFAQLVTNECKGITVTVLDPSIEMMNHIKDNKIIRIKDSLPLLSNTNEKYDYIHLKNVLHHVVGDSIEESRQMVKDSLLNIKKHIGDNGYLFIYENYQETYIYPRLTNILIFNLCKLQIDYNLKLPIKEFAQGLSVYFYTRNQMFKMLEETGYEVVEYHDSKWANNYQKRLLLLKDWGRQIFICNVKN